MERPCHTQLPIPEFLKNSDLDYHLSQLSSTQKDLIKFSKKIISKEEEN